MHRKAMIVGLCAGMFAAYVSAELRPLDEPELQAVSAQAGISLSANLTFALNAGNTNCAGGVAAGGCGARLAFKPAGGAGYLVVDNLSGAFSFDGATLDIVALDSSGGFGAESAVAGTQGLKIGLQNGQFSNFKWTLATANQAVAGGAGFKQNDQLSYQTNGLVKLQGNFYVFGTP
jgi:hypothetical protein